jgi:putative flippase GtrA
MNNKMNENNEGTPLVEATAFEAKAERWAAIIFTYVMSAIGFIVGVIGGAICAFAVHETDHMEITITILVFGIFASIACYFLFSKLWIQKPDT